MKSGKKHKSTSSGNACRAGISPMERNLDGYNFESPIKIETNIRPKTTYEMKFRNPDQDEIMEVNGFQNLADECQNKKVMLSHRRH